MEEVIAQVDALLDLAKRVTTARASLSERPPPPSHTLSGNLEDMSIVTVLTLLEMERRSGELKLTDDAHVATIDLASGYATGGKLEGKPQELVSILREVLAWKAGLFSFNLGPDVPVPAKKRTIAGMLVEAVLPQGRPARSPKAKRS
jgi:hypothetical protein